MAGRKSFAERVVVVTGATSGIGEALARAFTAAGARVVGTGRDPERLSRIEGSGAVDLALSCDVTSDRDVEMLAAVVEDRYGRLDVLVNNAGIGLFRPWDQLSAEDFQRVYDVNVFGVVRVTRALVPLMPEGSEPPAAVVVMASVASRRAFPLHAAYGSSKFALLGYADVLRLELAPRGIRVLSVLPPAVRTPFFERAEWPDFERDHPGVRMLPPERVAEETLDALLRGERERVVSTRARALDVSARLLPGGTEELRRRFRAALGRRD